MKFTLALLVVAAFVGCALSFSCTQASWEEYKATYNKQYAEPSEDQRHHDIYCANAQKIESHNILYQKGQVTWEMGINQFTDMSHEDMAQYNGYNNKN